MARLRLLTLLLPALASSQESCVDETRLCVAHGTPICRAANAYTGSRSTTFKGSSCIVWSEHLNGYPEQGAHSSCRNPDGDASPWCYVRVKGAITFEYCFPHCDSLPTPPGPGRPAPPRLKPRPASPQPPLRTRPSPQQHALPAIATLGGRSPVLPSRIAKALAAVSTTIPPILRPQLELTSPPLQLQFTRPPLRPVPLGIRVPDCVDEGTKCMRKGRATCGSPQAYTGKRNVTVSGRTCQKWSAQAPHSHTFGGVHGDHNFCRVDGALGPWCLTTDPEVKWEYCFKSCPDCVVEKRDCALRGQGICRQEDGYQGLKAETVTGKACQTWAAQSPHVHSFTAVGNHSLCRISGANAPWCFTTDPTTRWEYCYRPCNVFDIQNRDTTLEEDFGLSSTKQSRRQRERETEKAAAKPNSRPVRPQGSGEAGGDEVWEEAASSSSSVVVANSPTVDLMEFTDPIEHPDGEGDLLGFCDEYDKHLPFVCKVLSAQALCEAKGFSFVKSYRRAFDRKKGTKSWTQRSKCAPQFSALGGCWRYSFIRCSRTQDA